MGAFGLKRGVVPALRLLLVFGLTFLLAYTLKDPFYPVLQGVLRKMDPNLARGLSLLILEIVFFAILMGPALKYCRETVALYKQLDSALGAVAGLAAGLTVAGALIVTIMSIPGGRQLFGGGYDWYLAPHQYVLRAYEHFSRRMPGDRDFDASQAVLDLEAGVIEMPVGESGLWVCSVPTGLRVYIAQAKSGDEPGVWKKELEVVLTKSQTPIRIDPKARRQKRVEGYIGRTPVLVPVQTSQILVAVEGVLPEGVSAETESPFYWDGELGWWTQDAFGEKRMARIYRLSRGQDQKLLTHIAAFVLKGEDGAVQFERKLPSASPFSQFVDATEAAEKCGSAEAAARYLKWLKRGGKAVFESMDSGEVVILEVTPSKKLRELRKPATYQAPILK